MDVFEAMETCRAIRYLRPDPVPEELIQKLIYAATRASNPGNSQGWEFVALRDPVLKAPIGKALNEALAPVWALLDDGGDPVQKRIFRGAEHLVRHFAEVPLWVVVCARKVYPPQAPDERFVWSTVYPAAQNLVLGARALGLGTTFTTFHQDMEPTFRKVLGIPAEVYIGSTIAVGFPDRPFGPVARKPVDDVLHWDRW